jgi:hypothetical protein
MPGAVCNSNKNPLVFLCHPVEIAADNIAWFMQDEMIRQDALPLLNRREYRTLNSSGIFYAVCNFVILIFDLLFLLTQYPVSFPFSQVADQNNQKQNGRQ